MIERLAFDNNTQFNAIEASSHLARYAVAQPLCRGKRVLDVACGQGYGAYLMRRYWGARSVDGVDVAPEAIDVATRLFSDEAIRYHCRPAENLDDLFSPASFDLIVSLETIEHVRDAGAFIQVLRRHLKPDGTLVISCPNDHWYYPTDAESNPYHTRKFTLTEFLQVVGRHFGTPGRVMLGTPLSGFMNLAVDSPRLQTGGGDDSLMSLLKAAPEPRAIGLPSDEHVTEKNCSYFVAVWGPASEQAECGAAILYPCSMTASTAAAESLRVRNLRDEVLSLRDRLFESRANARWTTEQLEARERVIDELRHRTAELDQQLRSCRAQATAEKQRYGTELSNTQAALESARTALSQAQAERDAERARLDALASAHDALLARVPELEREVRRLGLRAQAFEAERDFIREQYVNSDMNPATAEEMAELQARNAEQARTIEEWRAYIKHIEGSLERAHERIERSLAVRIKRMVPQPVKRALKRLAGST